MILFYGYRDWTINIFNQLSCKKWLIETNDYSVIESMKPDIIFFIGWSEIIPEEIINNNLCICLHPSPLPEYRGGSPIQNQIIDGKETSAVSLFIMDKGIDTGDILYQKEIDLTGSLDNIFKRIELEGVDGINYILENLDKIDKIKIPQTGESSFYKRRKRRDSEITISEIENKDSNYIYNKIRCLVDPYPNAYIVCGDGKKVYLTGVKKEE